MVLLVSSLIFYAWGGPKYLLLLLLMAFISWFSALQIHRFRESLLLKRLCLILGVGLSLALLGYFKYAGFFLENLQKITGFPEAIPEIVLPIGISFYTFQLISYVVDVYWGNVKPQRRYWLILLYCSLFHQCIAGPIVRYKDVAREIEHRKPRIPEIGRGINRFTIGLVKKAVFANSCAEIADMMLPEGIMNFTSVPALGLWLGALMYMLQIYLDFSAYSDMAIGMGLMVGFHYKENFNYPYISNTVTEFWRRWHISLSSFFRDYVYIPLGGNRKGSRRTIINLFIVWALTGLWHGSSWNFVFWGLYYFIFLVLEKKVLLKKLEKLPGFVGHIYAMAVVYFGWIIFKFTDLSYLGHMLKGMFGLNHNGFVNLEVVMTFKNNIFFIIVAVIACTPLAKELYKWMCRKCKTVVIFKYLRRIIEIAGPVLLLLVATMALVGNSYNPFLYFQF
ncbi:MBOAT family O-acyltransferase [Frisingicoccus sp.]|uniref:MBOAT family O-acyltransferase n=1 Tax=Frisingicoccus sp. TaxID=1918627 RepID=UPI002E7A2816|nr:MBOAT family O-acyltransferase [Frisingicoccus sp.]